jgi:hypothetical protein
MDFKYSNRTMLFNVDNLLDKHYAAKFYVQLNVSLFLKKIILFIRALYKSIVTRMNEFVNSFAGAMVGRLFFALF